MLLITQKIFHEFLWFFGGRFEILTSYKPLDFGDDPDPDF